MPNVGNYFKITATSVPNTYVSSPECCPSRASILSGRYPHNTLITDAALPDYAPGD